MMEMKREEDEDEVINMSQKRAAHARVKEPV
jgi:hypothetical protein